MIEVSRVDDRDCENCKHRKIRVHDYKDLSIYGCERWKCKFEQKENADENTKTEVDI